MNYELVQQAATDVLVLLAADAPADMIQHALETYRIARIAFSAEPSGSTSSGSSTGIVGADDAAKLAKRVAKFLKMTGPERLAKLSAILERNTVLRSYIHHDFLAWFTAGPLFLKMVNASDDLAKLIGAAWNYSPKHAQRLVSAAAILAKGGDEGAEEARAFLSINKRFEDFVESEKRTLDRAEEIDGLVGALHSGNAAYGQEMIDALPSGRGLQIERGFNALESAGVKLDKFVPKTLDEIVDAARATPEGEKKLVEFVFDRKDLINGSDKEGRWFATYFGKGTVGGTTLTASLAAGAALGAAAVMRDRLEPAIMDCLDLNDDPVAFDACVKAKIKFQQAKDAKNRFLKPILLGAVGVGTYLAIDNWPTIKRSFK